MNSVFKQALTQLVMPTHYHQTTYQQRQHIRFFSTLCVLALILTSTNAKAAGNAVPSVILGFESSIEVADVHPQVSPVSSVYKFTGYIHPQSNQWVFFNWGRSARLIFTDNVLIQTESVVRPDSEGKSVTRNSATLHLVYKGIPITLDRHWSAAWFAYAAQQAIQENEGLPFPNAHGNVLYDLNSRCCNLSAEWLDQYSVAPMRALFSHSNDAVKLLGRFASKEELNDNPTATEAMRRNYEALSTNGTVVAEFNVAKWVHIGGIRMPEQWQKNIQLLGTPSLRISGSTTNFREISSAEFSSAILYDASQLDSVRDYRFLGLDNIDHVQYTMKDQAAKQAIPTNDVFFTQLVGQKQADTIAIQAGARETASPIGRVLVVALFVILLISPFLWKLMKGSGAR